jgi:hypothetical protein
MGLRASDSRDGGIALFIFALLPFPTLGILARDTGGIFIIEGIGVSTGVEAFMAELIAVEEFVDLLGVRDIGRPCSPLVILLLTTPVGIPDSLDRMDKLAPLGISDSSSSSDSSSDMALGTYEGTTEFTGEEGFPVEAEREEGFSVELEGGGSMGGAIEEDPELFKNRFTASIVSRTSLSCPCSLMTMK